jgi:transcriptional regulator with XRE-family HTH domain
VIDNVGLKIKDVREEKKLSQNEVVAKLAELNITMSRETLSKIETNKRTISAVELNALCAVYGIDISSIFDKGETDDLVTLFREKCDFNDEVTITELEGLQNMIKIFISQEELYKGGFQVPLRRPLWEEFI